MRDPETLNRDMEVTVKIDTILDGYIITLCEYIARSGDPVPCTGDIIHLGSHQGFDKNNIPTPIAVRKMPSDEFKVIRRRFVPLVEIDDFEYGTDKLYVDLVVVPFSIHMDWDEFYKAEGE
jgi:hypothetical protein